MITPLLILEPLKEGHSTITHGSLTLQMAARQGADYQTAQQVCKVLYSTWLPYEPGDTLFVHHWVIDLPLTEDWAKAFGIDPETECYILRKGTGPFKDIFGQLLPSGEIKHNGWVVAKQKTYQDRWVNGILIKDIGNHYMQTADVLFDFDVPGHSFKKGDVIEYIANYDYDIFLNEEIFYFIDPAGILSKNGKPYGQYKRIYPFEKSDGYKKVNGIFSPIDPKNDINAGMIGNKRYWFDKKSLKEVDHIDGAKYYIHESDLIAICN